MQTAKRMKSFKLSSYESQRPFCAADLLHDARARLITGIYQPSITMHEISSVSMKLNKKLSTESQMIIHHHQLAVRTFWKTSTSIFQCGLPELFRLRRLIRLLNLKSYSQYQTVISMYKMNLHQQKENNK